MIVCSCNLITESEIHTVLRKSQSPDCVRDVYAALGCTQDCGGCVGSVAHMIEEARLERRSKNGNPPRKIAALAHN